MFFFIRFSSRFHYKTYSVRLMFSLLDLQCVNGEYMSVSGTSLNDCHAGRESTQASEYRDPDPTIHFGADPDPDRQQSNPKTANRA
jgi:hypothetical protein